MTSELKNQFRTFYLRPGRTTPEIGIDEDRQEMKFEGRCAPETAINFFQPIEQAIEHYFEGGQDELTVNINLEYINTSSTKCLINLLKKLDRKMLDGKSVNINWLYEEDDIDMMEIGEDLSDLLGIDIQLFETVYEDVSTTHDSYFYQSA